MGLTIYSVLAVVAAISWWLSGYDPGLSMTDKSANLTRRLIRCGITLVLMGLATSSLLDRGVAGGWLFLALAVPLAVLWSGTLSALAAHGFHGLVDATDNRPQDSGQIHRDLDKLAQLVQSGRNEEALQLSEQLQSAGEASALAMETVLFQLYQQMFHSAGTAVSGPLANIRDLRRAGRLDECEAGLEALCRKEPANLAAVFLLMEVYARDRRRPAKAEALLQSLAQRPHMPPAFVHYVRRSLHEWSGALAPWQKTEQGIESLLVESTPGGETRRRLDPSKASAEELLAAGHLETAIEMLEAQLAEQPQNFDLWLKLAEAHAVHCGNFKRAGKVVDRLRATGKFTAEQLALARAKLREWQRQGAG